MSAEYIVDYPADRQTGRGPWGAGPFRTESEARRYATEHPDALGTVPEVLCRSRPGTPRLINLTPHTIRIRRAGIPGYVPGDTLPDGSVFPADIVLNSWGVARVATSSVITGSVTIGDDTVPVATISYGDVEGLPDQVAGTTYVVSLIVLQALHGSRPDVVAPGTGPEDGAVRYPAGHALAGQVEAVTRLVRL